MDCRKGLLFCLGLLVPLSGCVHELRSGGAGKVEDEVVKKPETFVAFADYRAATAFAPDTPPEAQQVYRDEARAGYLKAIEINPNHVPAYLALARLQQGCHDLPAALATYQKALQVTTKDAAIWYELGMCQARLKQFNESVSSLQKACELRPESKMYQETLGYALARAGSWGESLTMLTAVVGDARAHFCLGRMLQHMNQPEQARQYIAAALSRDPNLPGGRELFVSLGGTAAPDVAQNADYKPVPPTPVAVVQPPAAPLPMIRNAPVGAPGVPAIMPTGSDLTPQVIRIPPRPVADLPANAH